MHYECLCRVILKKKKHIALSLSRHALFAKNSLSQGFVTLTKFIKNTQISLQYRISYINFCMKYILMAHLFGFVGANIIFYINLGQVSRVS
jgi:hypothetical protein